MKIRRDFVANSSSYSSVIVRIQSKELAQLLAKYQHLFGAAVQILPDGIFVYECERADEWKNVPQSLKQLINKLLESLQELIDGSSAWETQEGLQDSLALQMEREIKANKQKLTDSVQKAVWDFQNNSYNEFVFEGMIGRRFFRYDQDQGGKGKYQEEPYSEDGYGDEFDELFDEEFDENEEE